MSSIDRVSAALPPGEPEEQVIQLLDRQDSVAAIAAIDPPTIFRLIHDAGWESAQPLVPLLTREQLQACVDLDCWKRQSFAVEKLLPWYAALVAEADDPTFRKHCRELDPEILALLFHKYVLVDTWGEEGEVPDQFWHIEQVERSPDGVYALVYQGDDSTNALMRAGLARMFEVDMVLAWTLLEAARWELKSNMEEEALRWRTSRLEEWGFVDFDEALQIYRPLDGAKFRERLEAGEIEPKRGVENSKHLPALLNLDDESQFYAATIMRSLEGETLDRVLAEFVGLQNRASVGEGIDPGERAEVEVVAERTTGYLSIGLEFLSRRDDARATEILTKVALRDVFRVGYTTVERLRENVQRIRRRPTLTLVEGQRFSLLREADAALCEALSSVRPQYADGAGDKDNFYTQSQVDDAASRLALIALKQLWLFGVMNAKQPELAARAYSGALLNEPPDLSFDSFFATTLCHVLLGKVPNTDGIDPGQVGELSSALRKRGWGDDAIGTFEPVVGPVFEALGGAGRLMSSWLEATLDWLVDELGAVSDPQAELFTALLVLKTADPR